MPQRAADRIAEAAARGFVGRSAELARLRQLTDGPERGPLVVFVHGPGGIGKSRLLQAVISSLPADVPATYLDCADVEPTPAGLLQAICATRGVGQEDARIERSADVVSAGRDRAVLVLDRYESFVLLDAWLRRELLPRLSAGVLTIIAGRDRPLPGWRTDPGWSDLFEEMELGELARSDAMTFLLERGRTAKEAERVLRFARGHPLALTLADSALRTDPALELNGGPPPVVVGELVRAILGEADAETVTAVEAASTVRRISEPLLAALLDQGPARDAFERLRTLAFATQTPGGLALHDVARDAVATDLRHRDPEALATYRRRAAGYLGRQVNRAGPEALWGLTADLLYLVDHHLVRDAFFSPGSGEHSVESAGPGDHDAIARVVAAWEPDADRWLASWLARQPEAFHVVRDGSGEVSAFFVMAEPTSLDPAVRDADPVVAHVTEHLRAVPLAAGERALLVRRGLSLDNGERPSAELSAAWLDLKRAYLEMRPRLRRVYAAMTDPDPFAAAFAALGFVPVGAPVRSGTSTTHCLVLDMGPRSVDGWLSELLDMDVGTGGPASPSPASGSRQRSPTDDLSEREAQVLLLLADGLSNQEIARQLVISTKTAGRHVENIYAKLGVRNRAQAARLAAESGLTREGQPP